MTGVQTCGSSDLLNNQNLSICIVGKDVKFHNLEEAELEKYINAEISGTQPATVESDPSEVGVGGTERQPFVYPPPPLNQPEPRPEDPATEQREQ